MTDEQNPDEADTDPTLDGDEAAAVEETEVAGAPQGLEELSEPVAAAHDLSGDLTSPVGNSKSSAFMGVPIEIIISVGKARPLVSDLVSLRRDSVITLDSKIDDPVEIFIGDRLIARGELQEMETEEGQLGVRLTEVADLSNGV